MQVLPCWAGGVLKGPAFFVVAWLYWALIVLPWCFTAVENDASPEVGTLNIDASCICASSEVGAAAIDSHIARHEMLACGNI